MAREKKNTDKEITKATAEKAKSGELTQDDLKKFLTLVRDKMTQGTCPPIFPLSTFNYILTMPNIYEIMNKENKELARDVWARVKKWGFQVADPPMLFGEGAGA